MTMRTIYIVEDDEDIRGLVQYALSAAGFTVRGFESGAPFFAALDPDAALPDLLLLDIMLPDEDGLSILKRLRQAATTRKLPVILLTARGSEYDKVRGLNMGADDYVAKPFGVTELIARVNAVLRRVAEPAQETRTLSYGGITLDQDKREVTAAGEAITLTHKEFELLNCLLINKEIVLTREKIMDAVWGYDFQGESRTVDMHIKTLRQKLGPAGEMIRTVRNVGYKIGGA